MQKVEVKVGKIDRKWSGLSSRGRQPIWHHWLIDCSFKALAQTCTTFNACGCMPNTAWKRMEIQLIMDEIWHAGGKIITPFTASCRPRGRFGGTALTDAIHVADFRYSGGDRWDRSRGKQICVPVILRQWQPSARRQSAALPPAVNSVHLTLYRTCRLGSL